MSKPESALKINGVSLLEIKRQEFEEELKSNVNNKYLKIEKTSDGYKLWEDRKNNKVLLVEFAPEEKYTDAGLFGEFCTEVVRYNWLAEQKSSRALKTMTKAEEDEPVSRSTSNAN